MHRAGHVRVDCIIPLARRKALRFFAAFDHLPRSIERNYWRPEWMKRWFRIKRDLNRLRIERFAAGPETGEIQIIQRTRGFFLEFQPIALRREILTPAVIATIQRPEADGVFIGDWLDARG